MRVAPGTVPLEKQAPPPLERVRSRPHNSSPQSSMASMVTAAHFSEDEEAGPLTQSPVQPAGATARGWRLLRPREQQPRRGWGRVVVLCACFLFLGPLLMQFYSAVLRLMHKRFGYGPSLASSSCDCCRGAPPRNLTLRTITTYYSTEGLGGHSDAKRGWERIVAASRANQEAYALKHGLEFKELSGGHSRCGKLPALLKALKGIPDGSWLFFIDADALFKSCGDSLLPLPAFVARWHARVHRDTGRDVDMLVISRFGLVAVRNSPWSRDFLGRLVRQSTTGQTLQCILGMTTPENNAFHAVATADDFCHFHQTADEETRVTSVPHYRGRYFTHFEGSAAKKDPQLRDEFLERARMEMRCLRNGSGSGDPETWGRHVYTGSDVPLPVTFDRSIEPIVDDV